MTARLYGIVVLICVLESGFVKQRLDVTQDIVCYRTWDSWPRQRVLCSWHKCWWDSVCRKEQVWLGAAEDETHEGKGTEEEVHVMKEQRTWRERKKYESMVMVYPTHRWCLLCQKRLHVLAHKLAMQPVAIAPRVTAWLWLGLMLGGVLW